MAVVNLKSVSITNREATPPVANNPSAGGAGVVRSVVGYLASVTASASDTSTIRMCEVPAHAIVTDLWFASGAQTQGHFSIGVYRNNKDGGAVVDMDFFATRVDCASAVALTDVLNESGTNTVTKQSQPLWQAVGMTEPSPGTMLDLVLTVDTTAVTTGAAAVILKAKYMI